MARQVLKKWGNSPAVGLPAAVMEAANPAVDQPVDVRAEHGRVILEAVTPVFLLDELIDGITPQNRHGKADTGAPQGNELLRL